MPSPASCPPCFCEQIGSDQGVVPQGEAWMTIAVPLLTLPGTDFRPSALFLSISRSQSFQQYKLLLKSSSLASLLIEILESQQGNLLETTSSILLLHKWRIRGPESGKSLSTMIQLKTMWMDHLLCLQNIQKSYKDSMDKTSVPVLNMHLFCLGLNRAGMKTNIHLFIYSFNFFLNLIYH